MAVAGIQQLMFALLLKFVASDAGSTLLTNHLPIIPYQPLLVWYEFELQLLHGTYQSSTKHHTMLIPTVIPIVFLAAGNPPAHHMV